MPPQRQQTMTTDDAVYVGSGLLARPCGRRRWTMADRVLAGLVVRPPPGAGAWPLPQTPTRTDERRVCRATATPPHDEGNTRMHNTDDAQRRRHPWRRPMGCPIPMMMATATRTRRGPPTADNNDDDGRLRTDDVRMRTTDDSLLLLGCPHQHLHEGHLALVTVLVTPRTRTGVSLDMPATFVRSWAQIPQRVPDTCTGTRVVAIPARGHG